jgi:hypothetical protein
VLVGRNDSNAILEPMLYWKNFILSAKSGPFYFFLLNKEFFSTLKGRKKYHTQKSFLIDP